MGMSRIEVNVRRILTKCELLAKEKNKDGDKLEKYLESIDDMLVELEKSENKPSNSQFIDYYKRLDKLKNTLHPNEIVANDVKITKKYNLNQSKLSANEKRKELFSKVNTNNSNLVVNDDNIDVLLKYHSNTQNNIVEEMLSLTENLKEQSKVAQKIIKQDTETLKKSIRTSDQNFDKLKVESEKLSEHSKRACRCWMWIMLIIVVVVFLQMVLFMKVMKKKS